MKKVEINLQYLIDVPDDTYEEELMEGWDVSQYEDVTSYNVKWHGKGSWDD